MLKLTTINPETWELISKNKKSLVFPIPDKNWLFQICGLYKKGLTELYLCPIPDPHIPFPQLKPLTDSDWTIATQKAQNLLSKI